MAYLTHCCCGCMTVRTGTKVVAILSVIDSLIGIIIYVTFAVYKKKVPEVFDDLPQIESSVEFNVGEFVAYIVIGVIGLIVSSLCIRGAYTDQRHYILPYLVFDAMILVVQVILVIWLIIVVIANIYAIMLMKCFCQPCCTKLVCNILLESQGATQVLLVVCIRVLWLCIRCYFYVVVLSFYKQLANVANNPGIRMVPAAQPIPPGTYVPPRSYSPAAPEPEFYTDSKMALV